ncbi:MAG: hypothetical protein H0T69_00535 [Thermoleophilaceae bacterium]|nr:hypothetical protein [Thermoleophilaceae bacterium]
MEGIALSDEDRAILDLEGAAVAGHTCKVVLVGAGAPTPERLRASVAARLAGVPAMTRRLSGPADRPIWIDDERFDIATHVVAAAVDPCGDDALRAEVARLFAERLDRSRPLWRIDVLPRAGDGAVLVWRIHHALADGTTAMRFADAVLWDAAPNARGDTLYGGPLRARRAWRRSCGTRWPSGTSARRSTERSGRTARWPSRARRCRNFTTPPSSSPARRSTTRCSRSSRAGCAHGSATTTVTSAACA